MTNQDPIATLPDLVDIVFDGPPGPEAGRFVEVEDASRRSISFGQWVHRDDGYWALRIPAPDGDAKLAEVRRLRHLLQDACAIVCWRRDGGMWTTAWQEMQEALLVDAASMGCAASGVRSLKPEPPAPQDGDAKLRELRAEIDRLRAENERLRSVLAAVDTSLSRFAKSTTPLVEHDHRGGLLREQRIEGMIDRVRDIEAQRAMAFSQRDKEIAENERLRSEIERLRGRDAEPFDWDAEQTVVGWIEENLPEREPRAGSKMVELHADEVVADRGEARRVAGWLKDIMAENAHLQAALAAARAALGRISEVVSPCGWTNPEDVVGRVQQRAAQSKQSDRMYQKLVDDLQADLAAARSECSSSCEEISEAWALLDYRHPPVLVVGEAAIVTAARFAKKKIDELQADLAAAVKAHQFAEASQKVEQGLAKSAEARVAHLERDLAAARADQAAMAREQLKALYAKLSEEVGYLMAGSERAFRSWVKEVALRLAALPAQQPEPKPAAATRDGD